MTRPTQLSILARRIASLRSDCADAGRLRTIDSGVAWLYSKFVQPFHRSQLASQLEQLTFTSRPVAASESRRYV
jgi:hypothetical protein